MIAPLAIVNFYRDDCNNRCSPHLLQAPPLRCTAATAAAAVAAAAAAAAAATYHYCIEMKILIALSLGQTVLKQRFHEQRRRRGYLELGHVG